MLLCLIKKLRLTIINTRKRKRYLGNNSHFFQGAKFITTDGQKILESGAFAEDLTNNCTKICTTCWIWEIQRAKKGTCLLVSHG